MTFPREEIKLLLISAGCNSVVAGNEGRLRCVGDILTIIEKMWNVLECKERGGVFGTLIDQAEAKIRELADG